MPTRPSEDAQDFERSMRKAHTARGVQRAVMGAIYDRSIDWDEYHYVTEDSARVVVFDDDGHQIVVEAHTNS